MRPLAELKLCRGDVLGVFLDIDDTLTTGGRLTAAAYTALERLHDAGLLLVPITGRPAGWCDHIARFWPVDAVVGENGAFYYRYDRAERRMHRRYWVDEAGRRVHRRRLQALGERIIAEVPGAAVAADQRFREADLAIDFREDVAALSQSAVQKIVGLFEQAGARAKVSSIHVNGWYGDYDKLSMTRRLMRECFNEDLGAQRKRYLFVGDSPNDAPMFRFFPLGVGVANIREFLDGMPERPAYVTASPAGQGFAELADYLLAARSP